MQATIDYLAWPPAYKLRKHRRAKHVRMRPCKQHGLEITVPYRFSVKELPAIFEENKTWIIEQMAVLQAAHATSLPTTVDFPMLNETWQVCYEACDIALRLVKLGPGQITIMGQVDNAAMVRTLLAKWCKKKAKKHLPTLLQTVSDDIQISYQALSIRDQRTRWGSCSEERKINLNYKLIFLPEDLVRHIMVHELCHIKHLDHSPAFWDLVATHDVLWKEHRRAMKHADEHIPAWL